VKPVLNIAQALYSIRGAVGKNDAAALLRKRLPGVLRDFFNRLRGQVQGVRLVHRWFHIPSSQGFSAP
jgi:hypothetical protein